MQATFLFCEPVGRWEVADDITGITVSVCSDWTRNMNFFFFFFVCTAPTFVVENEDSVNRLKQPASHRGEKKKKKKKRKTEIYFDKKKTNTKCCSCFPLFQGFSNTCQMTPVPPSIPTCAHSPSPSPFKYDVIINA